MNDERSAAFNSSFIILRSSFQNLARLQRPEYKVEFVEINPQVAGEGAQALFGGEVARGRRGRLRRSDTTDLREAAQDVLVEDGVAAQAHVAQEAARLFVAQPLDPPLAPPPVAPLTGVAETFEPLAQAHPAVAFEKLARRDDVAGARVRIAVLTSERDGQLSLRAAREQVADGLDGAEAHARRRARGEDAEDHLLPEPLVSGCAPDLLKLREARANLAPACAVRGANLFDSDWLSLSPQDSDSFSSARLGCNGSKFYGRAFGLVKRKSAAFDRGPKAENSNPEISLQEWQSLCASTTRRLCVHRLRCPFASKRSPPLPLPANEARRPHVSSCYDTWAACFTSEGSAGRSRPS